MTTTDLSRRQLLRRGAALAGALLVSAPFLDTFAASPDVSLLSVRLQLAGDGIVLNSGMYSFNVDLIAHNAGSEVITLQGLTIDLTLSAPQLPNMSPLAITLFDTAMYARSMPEVTNDLVAGGDTVLRSYNASFPPGFAPGPEWRGQVLRADAVVLLGLSTGFAQVACPPLELVFPA